MQHYSEATKDSLHKRLRRIEGQMRGLQKMLEENRDCREIIQQLNAAQSALQNATVLYVQSYAKDCLLAPDADAGGPVERETLVEDVIKLLAKH